MSLTDVIASRTVQTAIFEVRLEGGFRIYWSSITPTVGGCLDILAAPEFCPAAKFPGIFDEQKDGQWDLWPIDNPARPHPLKESDQLSRAVQITDRTLGIALISLQRNDDHSPHWLWVEIFLSAHEPAQNGRSVFEDWAEILRASKDDVHKQAVLRLNLGVVTPDEIAGFNSRKKLVASDLTLDIRPRPRATS